MILSILDVIVTLSQRNIALRGSWNAKTGLEDSTFQHFIEWKSSFDPILKDHIATSSKNATYLSPKTQNQLIQSVEHVQRSVLIKQANQSDFLSIMADETTDCSVKEQVSSSLLSYNAFN